jgi:CRISPR/Cas system CMR-associated protein Cmr1 (group 7 of RAMP superfamily)
LELKGGSNRRVEKIYSEEFHASYCTPVIIRKVKAGSMKWAEHASGMEEKCMQRFWWDNLKGRGHKEDMGADERIILKWILQY